MSNQTLFHLAQIAERIEGLKSFRHSYSSEPWKLVLWVILIPAIGLALIALLRRLQRKRDEISAFSQVARQFGLEEGDTYLLQKLADRKKIADRVRIVQTPACFAECMASFIEGQLSVGKDPLPFLRRTDRIREKLGFKKGLGTIAHTSDLVLPRKAMLTREDSETEVPLLLLPGMPDGLRIVVLTPGASGIASKNDTVHFEVQEANQKVTLACRVRSVLKKGPFTILHVGGSLESFLTRQAPGTFASVSLEIPDASSDGAPHRFPISVVGFDGREIQIHAPVQLDPGSPLQIHLGPGANTVRAVAVESNPGVGATHLIRAKVRDASSSSIATINTLVESG